MANHTESMVLKYFDQIAKNVRELLLPLVGPDTVGTVVEVVNRIPLGLINSLALVAVAVVSDDGFVVCSGCCSLLSSVVVLVEGSLVWITRAEDSSNDGTMIGKIVSEDEGLSVFDSSSLLLGAVSVGGIACVALSIAVGRSSSSIDADYKNNRWFLVKKRENYFT